MMQLFHMFFLFFTHFIKNVSDIWINKCYCFIVGVFRYTANAKTLSQCYRKLGIAMSSDNKSHGKGKAHHSSPGAFNKWTTKVHSSWLTPIADKQNIHRPTKTCRKHKSINETTFIQHIQLKLISCWCPFDFICPISRATAEFRDSLIQLIYSTCEKWVITQQVLYKIVHQLT